MPNCINPFLKIIHCVKINEVVGFTFIHDLVRSSYCEYYGRPANESDFSATKKPFLKEMAFSFIQNWICMIA